MLGKLMKHEFRATARLMLPLLLVVLGLAVLGRVYDGILGNNSDFLLVNALQFLLAFAFIASLIAAVVCVLVLMVQRFAKNLMGDEGYLMFTLPVNQHQLIVSKLLVSVVWFLAAIAVDILAVFIASYQQGMLSELIDALAVAWRNLRQLFNGTHGWIVLELVLLMLVSLAAGCLQFYAPIAIGHSFARHKGLYSVIFFFVIQFAMQFLGISSIDVSADFIFGNISVSTLDAFGQQLRNFLLFTLGTTTVAAVILYLITWLMMKKRLNLQ